MIVDIHTLQAFPVSNLNRGEDGFPKGVSFGGTRRARVSSQCWKAAIRRYMLEHKLVRSMGVRTHWVSLLLRKALAGGHPGTQLDQVIPAFVAAFAGKSEKDRTAASLFIGEDEIRRVAAALDDNWEAVCAETLRPPEEAAGAEAAPAAPKGRRRAKSGQTPSVLAQISEIRMSG